MKYIKLEGNKLKCTHPSVKTVWQTGYDARKYEDDVPVYRTCTHLLFNSSKTIFFNDLNEDYDEAEKYLQSI